MSISEQTFKQAIESTFNGKYIVDFDPLNDSDPIKAYIRGGKSGYLVEIYNKTANGYQVVCPEKNYHESFINIDSVIQKVQNFLG